MAREKILIVEDDWILAAHLQEMLTRMDYIVIEPVMSGEEALLSIADQKPDLILMDIQLSGKMNGIAASRRIGEISDVPIIFLSSYSDDDLVQQAKTVSTYSYLIKPVSSRELSVSIDMALYRNQIYQQLKESEERFYTLFQNVTSVAVQGYGADGITRYWNQASEHLYGYTAQEAIGEKLTDLIIPPEMQTDVKQAIRQMADTGIPIPASELSLMRKDGTQVPVFSSHTVLQKSGRVTEIFCIDIDLTELKQVEKEKAALEAQNRQLQKAESLGRMAGAIAHHFNNMLGAVIGNLELAVMDLPPESKAISSLNEAMKASQRAAGVSSTMLTYLGQTPGKREVMDLSRTCHMGLSTLRTLIPNKIIMEFDFPSPGPILRANTNQLQQIFSNLVTNAWESIGDNPGVIRATISTVSHHDIPLSHRVPVDWKFQNTHYACMSISDTGCGIAEEDVEKIFDPFFTTRFTGRGLGLPVILGIVRSHDGVICLESKPGSGSTFRIFLPVSAEELPLRYEKTVSAPETETKGTVLLIDDEEQMRSMSKMMLIHLGYSVLEANDGIDALEKFRQHQNDIRCVISDLTMPRMDGWDTLAALRRISPGIPVILSSGYDEALVMAGEHPERPNAFLGKPYQLQYLADTLRSVLCA